MADLFKPLHDLFFWVSEMENSIALRESQYVWPMFEVVHVVFMCLFAGLIVMMDLRLLGVGNMQTPFSQLQRRLFPWQMVGMAGAAMTDPKAAALARSLPVAFDSEASAALMSASA